METNEIVTLVLCVTGFLVTFFNTATSAHPQKWVRVAKFLPMVGFVVVALGIIALRRPSYITLWVLLGSCVVPFLAEFIDTALIARTSRQAWELFKSRLKHWPYVVIFAVVMLIAAVFMSPRQHASPVNKKQYTEAKQKMDDTWRGVDSARSAPLTPKE